MGRPARQILASLRSAELSLAFCSSIGMVERWSEIISVKRSTNSFLLILFFPFATAAPPALHLNALQSDFTIFNFTTGKKDWAIFEPSSQTTHYPAVYSLASHRVELVKDTSSPL